MKLMLNTMVVLDSMILAVIISLFPIATTQAGAANDLPEEYSEVGQSVSRYLPSPNTKHIGSGIMSDVLDVNYISTTPDNEQKEKVTVQGTAVVAAKEVAKNNGKDTIETQYKVLEKINQALVRGAIAPQEAAGLQVQVNAIGASESWYKSDGLPVPDSVVKENKNKLQALNSDIDKKSPLKLSSADINQSSFANSNSYDSVSRLIGQALTKDKISNSQAEEYYSKLAQIENDNESLKNDPASSSGEVNDLSQRLNSLKANIQSKLSR